MATGIEINSSSIALPKELVTNIITKTQEDSAVMSLATYMELPGLGATIPVITGDPEAEWVANETDEKKVARPGLSTKNMKAYTLAVIVPFSNQFKNNVPALYNAIVERLPMALASKFDSTVLHGTAPGSDFDTLASVTAQDVDPGVYQAFVDATVDIAEHDGAINGWVISPKGKGILLNAVDTTGAPLFNNVASNAIPSILGAPIVERKAAGKGTVIGFAGDWTKAIYGVTNALSITVSDQATINDNGTQINLWQRNMFAVRAEIECGFVCDDTVFNRLTTAK